MTDSLRNLEYAVIDARKQLEKAEEELRLANSQLESAKQKEAFAVYLASQEQDRAYIESWSYHWDIRTSILAHLGFSRDNLGGRDLVRTVAVLARRIHQLTGEDWWELP